MPLLTPISQNAVVLQYHATAWWRRRISEYRSDALKPPSICLRSYYVLGSAHAIISRTDSFIIAVQIRHCHPSSGYRLTGSGLPAMLGSCVLPSEMCKIPLKYSGVFGNRVVPLTVWVYLYSNFCDGLRKTHLFCNGVHIGRSRSSKVDDFDTTQRRICDFLLVSHSNRDPILHRFWDTATYWLKIANVSYPSLHLVPLYRYSFSMFTVKFITQILESWGYLAVKTAWS